MPDLRLALLLPLACAAAACQAGGVRPRAGAAPAASVTVAPDEDWRQVALPEHSGITEDLPPLFRRLTGAARRSAADANLLDPVIALAAATPAPGAYRCRIVRLPAPLAPPRRQRAPARSGFCYVGAEGDRLAFTAEIPARRIGGYLWPSAGAPRMVFLGAQFAPAARTAPAYSAGAAGNTAGIVERIGDFRYRLVVRGPLAGTVDVYELVAAPPPD